jgi:hypothetical protein
VAGNEIIFKIKVQKDGNLKVVAKQADKAAKSTEQFTKATEKTTKARNRFSKGEKGVGQAGLSSAKSFSKMQQTMVGGGGLVGAYATLAANVFALTAAFGILQRASAADQLAEGLAYTGTVAGRNLPYIADQLKAITGAAVSTQEAMSAVALATSSGFSSAQIGKLGEVAKGASLALGRDMTDALNRLIRGSAKLEPELLDELGIMVRLDDAAQTYATALGTTVQNLTQYQKRQAFVNAVIAEGEKSFSGIASAIDPNAYDQLAAALQDLLKDSVSFINKGLSPMVAFFSKSPAALLGGVLLFASTIRSALLPGLTQGSQNMAKFAMESKKAAEASFSNVSTTGKLPGVYNELASKIKAGTATTEDYTKAQGSLNNSLAKHARDLKNNESLQDTTTEKYREKQAVITGVKSAQQKLNTTLALSAQAETASAKATAINSASKLDFKGTITGIRAAMVAYRIELATTATANGSASASFVGLRVALMATGLSFKALGVAILTALPLLALIPVVLGLGKAAWDSWFGASDTVKKQEEVFESLSHLNEVGLQLNKTLLDIELRKAPTQGWDTFTAILTAAAGAAAQVRDRVGDAVSIQMTKKSTDLAAATKTRIDLEEKLANMNKGVNIRGYMATEAVLNDAISAQEKLIGDFNNLDAKPILAGLKEARVEAAALGNAKLAAHIDTQITGMAALAAQSSATAEEIGKVMSPLSSSETTVTLLESMNAGLNAFSEDLGKFSEKVETPFDKMSAGLDEAVKSLTQTEKVMGGFGGMTTRTTKEAMELRKELTKGQTPLSKFVEGFKTDADGGDPVVTLNRMNDGLKANIKIMQETPSKIKKEQIALKKLNDTRKVSGTITKAAHKIEKEIIRLKDEALQSSLRNLESLNLTGKKTAEILELDAKILENKAGAKSVERENLEILEGEQGFKKLILAQDQKSLDIAKDKLSRTQDQAKAAMIAANAADPRRNRSASLNAADELKLLEDSIKDRETIAVLEFNIAVQRTNMEYNLLKMKAKLLRKQGEGDADFQASMDQYDTQLEAMGTAALENLGDGLIETLRKINTLTKPKAAVRAEVLGATGTSAFEVNQNQRTGAGEDGNIVGALGGDNATLKDKLAVIKATIAPIEESLRKLGPEGELVAAVSSSSISIATSWTTAFTEIGEKVDSMSDKAAIANAVANTIAQTAQIMQAASAARIAGIDKEIAAEKKRDGKSKESLAKLKSLEKKKEQMARKAFEQNKKMQLAQIIASTAAGVMGIIGNEAPKVGSLAFILAATVAAMGAAQLAIVAGTSYQGGGSAGGASAAGPTSVGVGNRGTSSDLGKSQSARGELAYFRGEQGMGGAENFRSAFYGKKHRAAGGNTGYVVGEQGPELFMPDRPGTIVPADDTAAGGSSTNVTFSINAIDAAGVEDVLAQQQGNIIGMIREAANSYGQDFMEELDESTYTTPIARRA